MPEYTPNYNLALYNNTTDATQLFLDWRLSQAGETGTSNMELIDSAMFDLQTQATELEGSKGLIKVYATDSVAGTYTATGITAITSYIENMSILLALSSNITVAPSTLNINSLGAKTLMKKNSAGANVNVGVSDLGQQRFYIFTYDGTRWIWDNAFSAEQINVPSSTVGNFLSVSSDKTIEDSGWDATDFAPASEGVTNGNSHDHSGGDGAQIDYDTLSNLPSKSKLFSFDDFLAIPTAVATSSYLYQYNVLATGTIASIDGESNHNGIARISSSTSTNSGGYFTTGTTTIGAILLNGSMEMNLIFRIPTITSTTIRIGFHDSYTTTVPVDGVWANISAATLDGRTANNSTSSTTGTSYTISANTWYRLTITTSSDMATMTYALYASPGTSPLWTNTLTTNIPSARVTNLNFFAIRTAATTAAQLINLDYFDVKYNATR